MPSDTDTKILTEADITSAEEWANPAPDNEGFIVELPSGKVVRARRTMNMMDMIQKGQIPNPLREIVMSVIAEGDAGPANLAGHLQQYSNDLAGKDDEEKKEANRRLMVQFQDMINTVVCDTVLQPPLDMPPAMGEVTDDAGNVVDPNESTDAYFERLIPWEPERGSVSIFKVDLEDRMFLFTMSQGGVADAKRFREGQAAAVEALAHGEGVGRAAQHLGRGGRPDNASAPTSRPKAKGGAAKPKPRKSTGTAKKAPAKKKAATKKAAKKRT